LVAGISLTFVYLPIAIVVLKIASFFASNWSIAIDNLLLYTEAPTFAACGFAWKTPFINTTVAVIVLAITCLWRAWSAR
jgi:hypothetical protein